MMIKHQSLFIRLLSVLAATFVVTWAVVLYFGEKKLTTIVDTEQEIIYTDKLTTILSILELNNDKLAETGLVDAYKQGFQELALQSVASSFYHTNFTPEYPVILDYKGGIVLHPTLPAGDMSLADKAYVQAILNQTEGELDYVHEQEGPKWCVFRSFPSWEWVVLFTAPQHYKYREVSQFKREISSLLVFICLVALVVMSLLLYRAVMPIITLTKASKAIAEGDLDIELTSDRRDEVGDLTRHFGLMQDAIKRQINDIERQNKTLKEEIRQRKQSTAALIESEMRYREIFNTPTDAILLIDAQTGAIADVNRGMLEMFGCSYSQAMQMQLKELLPATRPYSFRDGQLKIKKVIDEGPQTFEWMGKKVNGDTFWMEISLKLTAFGEIQYLLAVARNIHERKVAVQALEEEQERLAVTLRSIGEGVIATDENGRVVLLNNIGEELTGWQQSRARGTHFQDVFMIRSPAGEQSDQHLIKQLIEDGSYQQEDVILVSHRDRQEKHVALSGAPIKGRDGKVYGAVVVFRDISDTLRMEAEMLKMKKLESIGVLAGGLAHDFNNIIFGIQGNIHLALSTLEAGSKVRGYLKAADKATVRAADLTQQLLTFARGGEPVKKSISLASLPAEAARLAIGEAEVELIYNCAPDLWPVEADSSQLSQVFQNIVSNAVQAMSHGGVVTITAANHHLLEGEGDSLLLPGKYVHLTISDQGEGIPPEHQEKIFDPYFSTRKKGQGLGLAICHSVVKNHGGTITVDSTAGQGTTFHLYLPAATHLPEQQPLPVAPLKDDDRRKKCVLVMDDEEMIRRLVTEILQQEGYVVATAKDGDEAIAIYHQMQEAASPPDVVIMDLTVPGGKGGKEAAREIRKFHPQARLIVSSGYSNDPVLAHYREHGFCEVLPKPYRRNDLCCCVATAMNQG